MTAGICEIEIEDGQFFSGDSSSDFLGEVIGDCPDGKGFRNGSATAKDGNVKGVDEEVNIDKGSTVDSYVSVKIDIVSESSVNIHLDVSDNGEVKQVSRTSEAEKVNRSENMVVEKTDGDSGRIINSDSCMIPTESSQTTESRMEDSEFIIEDTESVEVDVEFQALNKANVDIIDDNKNAPIVVMENVEDALSHDDDDDDDAAQLAKESEHPLEIIDDDKESQIVVMDNVHDDKQTEVEVEEAPVKEDPILIFPATFVSPEINIQFGSFRVHEKDHNRHPGDLSAMLEISNRETESTGGANGNNLDDLQGSKSAEKVTHEEVKDMDEVVSVSSVEVSSEFMGAQIEDTDSKVHKVEDMIKHETLCLKDEKQFIPETEQLKSYPDQLVSNVESRDEVQQAVNQKDEIEEPLENLRKELNPLKDNVSEVEVAALATRKTYQEENEKGKEVEAEFQAADVMKSISVVSLVEQGEKTGSSSENKDTDYQTMKKVAGKVRHLKKTKEPVKLLIRDSVFACLNETMEDEEKEETMVELDRKADELRKEEAASKLAQKEAEQKEKAREKRLRKKERKRTGGDNMSSSKSMKDENTEKLKEANETEKTNQKPQGPPAEAMATGRKSRGHQWRGKMGMAAVFLYILFFLSSIISVQ